MPIRRHEARARIELQRSVARAPDEAAHKILPRVAGSISKIWSVLTSGALDGIMLSIIVAVHNQLEILPSDLPARLPRAMVRPTLKCRGPRHSSRLRKNSVGTLEFHWSARLG